MQWLNTAMQAEVDVAEASFDAFLMRRKSASR
jgi:hypothetical protein